jgi:hypothetical protein
MARQVKHQEYLVPHHCHGFNCQIESITKLLFAKSRISTNIGFLINQANRINGVHKSAGYIAYATIDPLAR